MTASQHRFRIAVLLLGMALLPLITLSQSENKDLGIVRVRYVTIVVRDYDEALNWYTKVLGQNRALPADERLPLLGISAGPRSQVIAKEQTKCASGSALSPMSSVGLPPPSKTAATEEGNMDFEVSGYRMHYGLFGDSAGE